jgi:hypothetical protein
VGAAHVTKGCDIVKDPHDAQVLAKAIGEGYRDHMPLPPMHTYGVGDVLYYIWDSYMSYVLALFLLFYDNIDQVVSWGGFILLIVRLIADGPRAARTIKEWINGKR